LFDCLLWHEAGGGGWCGDDPQSKKPLLDSVSDSRRRATDHASAEAARDQGQLSHHQVVTLGERDFNRRSTRARLGWSTQSQFDNAAKQASPFARKLFDLRLRHLYLRADFGQLTRRNRMPKPTASVRT
jgi:hypothetical protein